mmetsp:Transcript_111441/g.314663  ORF Transcript_111441/g.314663 Transcript_111441/m.314663 type:complete len:590 (+) Transcript_111441:124-1893(+)
MSCGPPAPTACGGCAISQLSVRQFEVLKSLVAKHVSGEGLKDFCEGGDFAATSTERGVQRWKHAHLVAALDIINSYQRDRRSRGPFEVAGYRPSVWRRFVDDPRTRLCALLKRWLRARVDAGTIGEDGHPLPGRADPAQQRAMRGMWSTRCGAAVAAVVSSPWCVRLFSGCGAEDKDIGTKPAHPEAAVAIGQRVAAQTREARADFDRGHFATSGFVGLLREPEKRSSRERYLAAVEGLFDLTYLLGAVLVQFHRVSEGLGDYGMVRIAPWLHPFLEVLGEKVQRLRSNVEQLGDDVESMYVFARARGAAVAKPAPSERMCARAHACLERAVKGRQNHVRLLLQALEELRARSAPERLPHVVEGVGDACAALRVALTSQEFKRCAGFVLPELPQWGADERAALAKAKAGPDRDGPQTLLESSGCSAAAGAGGKGLAAIADSSNAVDDGGARVSDGGKTAGVAVDASTSSGRELVARVHRLSPTYARAGATGLRRHDQRGVRLVGDVLEICKPWSNDIVKTAIEVRAVKSCELSPGDAVLSLAVRKRAGDGTRCNTKNVQVEELKCYAFEFPSASLASAFHDALLARGAT